MARRFNYKDLIVQVQSAIASVIILMTRASNMSIAPVPKIFSLRRSPLGSSRFARPNTIKPNDIRMPDHSGRPSCVHLIPWSTSKATPPATRRKWIGDLAAFGESGDFELLLIPYVRAIYHIVSSVNTFGLATRRDGLPFHSAHLYNAIHASLKELRIGA